MLAQRWCQIQQVQMACSRRRAGTMRPDEGLDLSLVLHGAVCCTTHMMLPLTAPLRASGLSSWSLKDLLNNAAAVSSMLSSEPSCMCVFVQLHVPRPATRSVPPLLTLKGNWSTFRCWILLLPLPAVSCVGLTSPAFPCWRFSSGLAGPLGFSKLEKLLPSRPDTHCSADPCEAKASCSPAAADYGKCWVRGSMADGAWETRKTPGCSVL